MPSPLQALATQIDPLATGQRATAQANQNATHNTYITLLTQQSLQRAAQLRGLYAEKRPPLYGIPVSVKDCFDIAGTVTTCGSRFYAEHNHPAQKNSWIAQRLLDAGAIIPGKTHLHQLAYGITGENADYGDCLQPRDADLLTGGSSSGAAASIQEGSALVAIGTDTGGSVRVPSALCSLAGYRTSRALNDETLWSGGFHLAPTFDTLGILFRDLRDAAFLAESIFDIKPEPVPATIRIGCISDNFLQDCEPEVLDVFKAWKNQLTHSGATLATFNPEFWSESPQIYSPIVASESAVIHHGNFEHFEPVIAERMAYGASIPVAEIQSLHQRLEVFRLKMATLFENFDLLLAPCAPISRLRAGHDHTESRKAVLRYTTPPSLAGLPAVTLPGEAIGAAFGTGMQLLAAPCHDATLLAFASILLNRD
ncbi:MAG TPA: amidase [Edaphobacter sp.]|jgi:Asp-tRNA(Asn)/Glu-tRNA(Gln) amidotransferase A subunit family amidase|nr:amidase [Edaphobacter sp.]